jgi:hypothetical protein
VVKAAYGDARMVRRRESNVEQSIAKRVKPRTPSPPPPTQPTQIDYNAVNELTKIDKDVVPAAVKKTEFRSNGVQTYFNIDFLSNTRKDYKYLLRQETLNEEIAFAVVEKNGLKSIFTQTDTTSFAFFAGYYTDNQT